MNVTPIDAIHAGKKAESVLLYVFIIAFTASLFNKKNQLL